MQNTSSKTHRVIVCGTRFGEHYLAALKTGQTNFELIGIFANGSARSTALAEHFSVPLYDNLDDIPLNQVDAAFVVVRSGVFGGEGTKLAQFFLEHGISVLQEHPVHPGEIARCKRTAKRTGSVYHVNSFYSHLPAGRTLIEYVRQTCEQIGLTPTFVEISTSLQLLFSSLDILAKALGGLSDSEFAGPLAPRSSSEKPFGLPFSNFAGQINQVPVNIGLQNYIDPRDPDHYSLVMHRMNIGWQHGTVQLVNSFGPVIWTQSLYAPEYDRNDEHASYLLHPQTHEGSHYFQLPTALPLGPTTGESVANVVAGEFPIALASAFADFSAEISGDRVCDWQSYDYLMGLGQAWLSIMRQLGEPENVELTPPQKPKPDPLEFARSWENYIG